VLVKVIFAFGTVATLAALFLKYRKDSDRRLLILGGVGVIASAVCFVLSSIDLARLKAPRGISPEQQKQISEKVKEFAGQEYAGLVAPGVGDAWVLWERIAFSLDQAGWKFWCCVSRPIDRLYAHDASIWQGPPSGGVVMFWPAVMYERGIAPEELQTRARKATGPAQALAKALTAEGLTAFSSPRIDVNNHPVVVVAIGPKP
jgi:hypothetical protein